MASHPRSRSRRPADYGAALWIACFSPQASAEHRVLPALTDADLPLARTVPPPAEPFPPLPVYERTHWRALCA
jgi:hypothetical protein